MTLKSDQQCSMRLSIRKARKRCLFPKSRFLICKTTSRSRPKSICHPNSKVLCYARANHRSVKSTWVGIKVRGRGLWIMFSALHRKCIWTSKQRRPRQFWCVIRQWKSVESLKQYWLSARESWTRYRMALCFPKSAKDICSCDAIWSTEPLIYRILLVWPSMRVKSEWTKS